ncbi:MAG: putative MAP kinase kinase family domain protein [Streblomastix strix]|uniref:non-specific serine/threonine protein kinase n=1 Tax=Streblomastix strix TaxID=222440 RepID=A0A5J4XB38_9EUKA|nr:MAG: putative MAP kinase kinase family domain protein [Streblomastix strix]
MSHSKVSDFKKIKQLGKGSYGTTYLVERLEDGNCYCMKVIQISALSSKEQKESIDEACFLAQLNSEFIVQYYDSFIDGGMLYIVMEFADGGSLEDLIKDEKATGVPIEEDEVWRYFFEISIGLLHIHSKKMIHRDMKPGNVFLTSEKKVKIGDLGVAKLLITQEFAQTMVGTPYYLSPELVAGKKYDARADVWALGCIVYELMTYNKPFEATNSAALIFKILQDEPSDVPKELDYTDDLRMVVKQMLKKDYTTRPTVEDLFLIETIQEKAEELGFDLEKGKRKKKSKKEKKEKEPKEEKKKEKEKKKSKKEKEKEEKSKKSKKGADNANEDVNEEGDADEKNPNENTLNQSDLLSPTSVTETFNASQTLNETDASNETLESTKQTVEEEDGEQKLKYPKKGGKPAKQVVDQFDDEENQTAPPQKISPLAQTSPMLSGGSKGIWDQSSTGASNGPSKKVILSGTIANPKGQKKLIKSQFTTPQPIIPSINSQHKEKEEEIQEKEDEQEKEREEERKIIEEKEKEEEKQRQEEEEEKQKQEEEEEKQRQKEEEEEKQRQRQKEEEEEKQRQEEEEEKQRQKEEEEEKQRQKEEEEEKQRQKEEEEEKQRQKEEEEEKEKERLKQQQEEEEEEKQRQKEEEEEKQRQKEEEEEKQKEQLSLPKSHQLSSTKSSQSSLSNMSSPIDQSFSINTPNSTLQQSLGKEKEQEKVTEENSKEQEEKEVVQAGTKKTGKLTSTKSSTKAATKIKKGTNTVKKTSKAASLTPASQKKEDDGSAPAPNVASPGITSSTAHLTIANTNVSSTSSAPIPPTSPTSPISPTFTASSTKRAVHSRPKSASKKKVEEGTGTTKKPAGKAKARPPSAGKKKN